AHHDRGTIEIPPITSEERYARAVHEIGHIRNGLPDIADDLPEEESKALLIADERPAWDWARPNTPIWTPAMDREAARSLRFYEVGTQEDATYELVSEFAEEFINTDGDCGASIGDALIRYAVEFFSCGADDQEEAREWLIERIDKNLQKTF